MGGSMKEAAFSHTEAVWGAGEFKCVDSKPFSAIFGTLHLLNFSSSPMAPYQCSSPRTPSIAATKSSRASRRSRSTRSRCSSTTWPVSRFPSLTRSQSSRPRVCIAALAALLLSTNRTRTCAFAILTWLNGNFISFLGWHSLAEPLVGLAKGGRAIQKCKETYKTSIDLLIKLASLQVLAAIHPPTRHCIS